MVSASTGDVDTLKLLLKRGAKLEAVNTNGFTAFLIAAEAGKVEAARRLLDQGAKFDVTANSGFRPLIIASRNGHLEMVKFLLERGAKLDARDKVGFTALHEAADRGHAEVAEFLINRGAEADTRCYLGGTPLHNTANGFFTNETRYVAVVKVLLAHGADVNARRRGNQTPLHRAAEWGARRSSRPCWPPGPIPMPATTTAKLRWTWPRSPTIPGCAPAWLLDARNARNFSARQPPKLSQPKTIKRQKHDSENLRIFAMLLHPE
jgi:ankyrin repeat protein